MFFFNAGDMEGFLSDFHIGAFPIHSEFPPLGGLNKGLMGFGKGVVTLVQSVGNWLYKFGKTEDSIKYTDETVDGILGAMMRTQTLRGLDIPTEEVIRRRNHDFLTMFTTFSSIAITTNSAGLTKKIPRTYFKTDEDEITPKGPKPAGAVGKTLRDKEFENVGTNNIQIPSLHPIIVHISFSFTIVYIQFPFTPDSNLELFTSNSCLPLIHLANRLHPIHIYIQIILFFFQVPSNRMFQHTTSTE